MLYAIGASAIHVVLVLTAIESTDVSAALREAAAIVELREADVVDMAADAFVVQRQVWAPVAGCSIRLVAPPTYIARRGAGPWTLARRATGADTTYE